MGIFGINIRIAQLINRLNLSQNAFAKAIGTSSSRISNITTGRNKPDSDLLILILTKYRDVNSDWLMLGQGDIFIDENAHLNAHLNTHLNDNLSKDSLQKATPYIQNGQVALAKEGQPEYNNISLAEKERIIEVLREVIKSKDAQLEDKQKIIDLLSRKG